MAHCSKRLVVALVLNYVAAQVPQQQVIVSTVTVHVCRSSTLAFSISPATSAAASRASLTPVASPSAGPSCPASAGQDVQNAQGESYLVLCDESLGGATIEKPASRKRQSLGSPTLEDCLETCGTEDACVAVGLSSGVCSLFVNVTRIGQLAGAQAAVRTQYAASNPLFADISSQSSGSMVATDSSTSSGILSSYMPSNYPPPSTTGLVTSLSASGSSISAASSSTASSAPTPSLFSASSVVSSFSGSAPAVPDPYSSRLSEDTPQSTSPDTVVYIATSTPSIVSQSASTTTMTMSSAIAMSSASPSIYSMMAPSSSISSGIPSSSVSDTSESSTITTSSQASSPSPILSSPISSGPPPASYYETSSSSRSVASTSASDMDDSSSTKSSIAVHSTSSASSTTSTMTSRLPTFQSTPSLSLSSTSLMMSSQSSTSESPSIVSPSSSRATSVLTTTVSSTTLTTKSATSLSDSSTSASDLSVSLSSKQSAGMPQSTSEDTVVYLTMASGSSSLADSSTSSVKSSTSSPASSSVVSSIASPSVYSVGSSTSSSLSSSARSSTASASATAIPAGTPVRDTGKRGLCYTQANYTLPFSLSGQNSQVSWAYDWFYQPCPDSAGATYDGSSCGYNPAIEHIPLLYSDAPNLLSVWSGAANRAIAGGATALMSFNEPDICYDGSACMTINASVTAYKSAMQPFAGRVPIGAPAVTTAGAPAGLTYLQNFIGNCTGCQIDFVNIHWYSNKYAGASYFEYFVNQARLTRDMFPQTRGKPIWITEFGLTNDNDGSPSYTDADLQRFLGQVMPWLDQQADVARYAYFMDAPNILINSTGNGLSGNGIVYNSFVNTTRQPNL